MENEITWFGPAVKGRRGVHSGATVTTHPATKADKQTRTVIRLYPDAMKKFRLLAGDRILVGKGVSGLFIKRTTNGGFALSSAKPDETRGTHATSYVKIQEIPGLQDRAYSLEEMVEQSDGMIFMPI